MIDGILIIDVFIEAMGGKKFVYLIIVGLMQVGQFVNCLIEARNELQHKYARVFLINDRFVVLLG